MAFGKVVAMDLKYLKDKLGNHFVLLSIVDAGTSYHNGSLLKNGKAKHVVRKFLEVWIKMFGVPETVIVDQGGEFEKEMNDMFEEYNIDSRITGSKAGWQHGFAERHGGIFGEIWDHVVQEFSVTGKTEVKMAMSV